MHKEGSGGILCVDQKGSSSVSDEAAQASCDPRSL
jgi:hypothetical protein